jgi:hypothetical protein
MVLCSNKENCPPTTSKLLCRQQKLSTKKSEAHKNVQEAAKAKQVKKQLQVAQAKKRALVKKASVIIECAGDSKEVCKLKGKLLIV